MFKKFTFVFLPLVLAICLCLHTVSVFAVSNVTPAPQSVLQEYEKLIQSYKSVDSRTNSQTVSYPDNYGGAYYGDDGYLHINVTTSSKAVDDYTNIVSKSLTRFHQVKFSYNYLLNIHDVVRPHMDDCDIYKISTIQADNKTYIYTTSEDYVDDIKLILSESSVNPESCQIIVEQNSIVPATQSGGEIAEESSRAVTATYLRPGDAVYNWSRGYAQSWATVLCNARKLVNGSYVYGFITAAHLWYNCTSAGDRNRQMSTKAQATTNYSVDATFIPFNSTGYNTTAKIQNSNFYGDSSYHLQYYFTAIGEALEEYSYDAFGKTSGHTDGSITIISTSVSYRLLDSNTNTYHDIVGIQTTGYSLNGDSGGPVAYYNTLGSYTLLGMTSARDEAAAGDSYIVPVCDIFAGLGVEMLGGTS